SPRTNVSSRSTSRIRSRSSRWTCSRRSSRTGRALVRYPRATARPSAHAPRLSAGRAVVKILERKAERLVDDAERASIYRRIGETKRDMLEDPKGATIAYERALELDGESTFTLDSLIELCERGDDHRKLVELYRRRIELT